MNGTLGVPGLTAIALVAALGSLAAEAHAAPPGGQEEVEAPPSQPPVNHWYGYQTLLADGAALTITVPGFALKSNALFVTGLVPMLFAPPIVHIAHGNVGHGIASFAIRACAPVALAYVALLASTSNETRGIDPNALFAGFLSGWGIAAALDAAVFSWEKVMPPRRADAHDRGGGVFTWRPDVTLGQRRGTVGIAGTF